MTDGASSLVGGRQPSSRQSPPSARKPDSADEPSNQTASPGQFWMVTRLPEGTLTSSW